VRSRQFFLCDVRAKADVTVFVIEPGFLRSDLQSKAEETIDHKALSMIDFKGRVRLIDF
jgi:hypothetical protein